MNALEVLFINAALLVGIWQLFVVEYHKYLIDETRQRLFALRDELFQQAEQGKVSFDSNAYRMLRSTLNGMIRFTHDLSFWRFVAATALHDSKNSHLEHYISTKKEALSALPSGARKIIESTYESMNFIVVAHVARRSLVIRVLAVPAWWVMNLLQLVSAARSFLLKKSQVSRRLCVVDAEANEIGRSIKQFAHVG